MRTCRTCGVEIYKRSKCGLCRMCMAHDPEMHAKRQAAARRAYQLRPEILQAATARLVAATKTPEHAERARRQMVEGRLWERGVKVLGPKGAPLRRQCAITLSNTRLAHIPPELRDEYRHLVNSKGFKAAEARAMIEEHHAVAMDRWRRGVGVVVNIRPAVAAVDLDSEIIDQVAALTGVSREEILSDRRPSRITDARALIAMSLREDGLTYREIAAIMKRDHCGVMHLIETFDARLAKKPALAAIYDRLTEALAA